jgi:hypothetical protein
VQEGIDGTWNCFRCRNPMTDALVDFILGRRLGLIQELSNGSQLSLVRWEVIVPKKKVNT